MSSLHRYGSLIVILRSFGVLRTVGFGIMGVAELELVGVIVIVPPVVLDEAAESEEDKEDKEETGSKEPAIEDEATEDDRATEDELVTGSPNRVVTFTSIPQLVCFRMPVELPSWASNGMIGAFPPTPEVGLGTKLPLTTLP